MKENQSVKKEIDGKKFIESVYHVIYYGNILSKLEQVFTAVSKKISKVEATIIRFSVQWNVMIITISLLDEMNGYLFCYKSNNKVTKDKIKSYRYIVQPALKEIRKWHDLRSFRNNVLAHNFRIRANDYVSVHLSNNLHNYIIPQHTIDLILLLKYLRAVTKIAEEIFQEEYREALEIAGKHSKPIRKKPPLLANEVTKANLIIQEMNDRIANYNAS